MDVTDEALWAAVRSGDDEAFTTVFRRHCDAVHTQCARRTGSYDAADDLLSAVFLQAWRCRSRVRFVDGSLRPWLLVVASNVAATHNRGIRRKAALARKLAATTEVTANTADEALDAFLIAESLAPLLAAAISTLTSGEQAVVGLCDLGGCEYAAAAGALGVPVGTVKSRLSRAHQKLRKRLGASAAADFGLSDHGNAPMEVSR
ncbi:MAG: sigma-70 family RNA polymerase sigma factor [Marmoricola sp.]